MKYPKYYNALIIGIVDFVYEKATCTPYSIAIFESLLYSQHI
jgi:hypothetical protein